MSQNARSHRKLKIAGVVALVLVVALLGFAGNFLFDFALNPQAPYTMKMMQDSKNDKEGEQPDAEETEARAWFKENRESSSLTADDGTELAAWYFAASENTHDYAVCLHGYTNEPIGMARYAKRFHDRGMNVRAGYDFHKAISVEQLKHATVPMLFIHGDQDTFVPYDMLDQNYDACASKVKQKLTIHGATHAKSAQVDPELYWNTVNNFLDEYF